MNNMLKIHHLTTAEVAIELGVTVGRVCQLLASEELKGAKHGRDWAVPLEEVRRYQAIPRDPRGRPPGGGPQPKT